MRILLNSTIAIFVLLLISCGIHQKKSSKEVDYFEGEIEFKITFEPLGEMPIPIAEYLANIPNRSVMNYSNGNYQRDMYHDDSLIVSYLLVLKDTMNYSIKPTSDTVLYSNYSIPNFNTDAISYSEGETIIGFKTTSCSALMRGIKGTLTEGVEAKQVYSNAIDLPINPEHFKNFTEGRYNSVIEKYPGISLQNEISYFGYYRVTETAIRVDRKEIELNLDRDPTKIYVLEVR